MVRQGRVGQGGAGQGTIAWRRLVCGLHELKVHPAPVQILCQARQTSPHHILCKKGGVRPLPDKFPLFPLLCFRASFSLSSLPPHPRHSNLTVQCLPSQTTKSKTSSPSLSRVHFSSLPHASRMGTFCAKTPHICLHRAKG